MEHTSHQHNLLYGCCKCMCMWSTATGVVNGQLCALMDVGNLTEVMSLDRGLEKGGERVEHGGHGIGVGRTGQ